MKIIKRTDPLFEQADELDRFLTYYQNRFSLESSPRETLTSEALVVAQKVVETKRLEFIETYIRSKPVEEALVILQALQLMNEGFILEGQESYVKEKESNGDSGLVSSDNKGTVRRGRKK